MKAFWWSLIGFCVLMCSCKTQKVDSSTKVREQVSSELSVINVETKVDTSKVVRVDSLKQRIVIEEELTIIEYDKESGQKVKETNAKRKTTQDTEKVATEEEIKGVSEENDVLVKGKSDFSKTLDSEVESESIGGQESFGKYFGIGLACVIGLLVVYLLRKFRVN